MTRVAIKSQAKMSMRTSSTVGTNATSSLYQASNHLNNLDSVSSLMSVSTAGTNDLFRQSVEQSPAALMNVTTARIDELFGQSVEQREAALRTNNLGRASFVHHSAGVLAAPSQLDQWNMKDRLASAPIGSSNLHPIQPIPQHDNVHDSKDHSLLQSVMNSYIQRKLERASFVHHAAGVLAASDKVPAISTQENVSSMRNMSLQLKSLHIPVDPLQDEDILDDLKKIDEMFGQIGVQHHQSMLSRAQFERASFVHHENKVLAGPKQLATQLTPSHLSSFQSSEHKPQNRSIHSKNNRVDETTHYRSILRQNFERASFVHHSAGVLAGSDMRNLFQSNISTEVSSTRDNPTNFNSFQLPGIWPQEGDDDDLDKKIDDLFEQTMKKRPCIERGSFVHHSAGVLASTKNQMLSEPNGISQVTSARGLHSNFNFLQYPEVPTERNRVEYVGKLSKSEMASVVHHSDNVLAASEFPKPAASYQSSRPAQIRRVSSEELTQDGDICDALKTIDEKYGHLVTKSNLSSLTVQECLLASNVKGTKDRLSNIPSPRVQDVVIPENSQLDGHPLDNDSFSIDPIMIDDIDCLFDQNELDGFEFTLKN